MTRVLYRAVATLAFSGVGLAAQHPATTARTVTGWTSQQLVPATNVAGVVLLLPGMGGTAGDFGVEPLLAQRLRARSIAVVVITPSEPQLFFDQRSIARLDSTVAEILQGYGVAPARAVIGGLSSGGTGAVRLAEACANRRCRTGGAFAAVFAVDAPLDLERIWHGETLTIQRGSPKSNADESRMLLAEIRRVLGGSPSQQRARYELTSAFAADAKDGGRIAALRTTPVRMYTEPDVDWWIENRGLDYFAMNALDAAALINQLRILGNAAAELRLSSGQGIRPDGRRHPHSWSIVDQSEMAAWISRLLSKS